MKKQIIRGQLITTNMREVLKDIYVFISWLPFSGIYFKGRSISWLYNKMKGIDGNGGIGGFNDEEAKELRNALIDLAERIRIAAEKIE